ncbi:uncharacterized protein [Watersipora subatra]|uniref:uncharacterized protein n=1 Tax=Watersipora subatra TaxID=2589382 RepID=UPI00355B6F57
MRTVSLRVPDRDEKYQCCFRILAGSSDIIPSFDKITHCTYNSKHCKVFEFSLNDLPAYDVAKAKPKSCDVCTLNGEENGLAVVYCVPCDKVFCAKHDQKHKEFFKDFGESHKTMNMEQFEQQKSWQQSRVCVDHDNKPFTIGCRKCLKMVCSGCLSSAGSCSNGDHHQMMSLDELVVQLNEELHRLKKRITEKEESLEKVFKSTSETLADYDRETDDMLKKIYKNRDEQMESLRLQYQQLEEEFIEARLKTKTMITDYLEDNVLSKWSQLRNFYRTAESRAQHAHDCDVVSGYRRTRIEIQRLVEEDLPSLDIPVAGKLREKAGKCEMNLEIASSNGFSLDHQLTLEPIKPLPKFLKLLHTIALPRRPYSVKVCNSKIFSSLFNKSVVTIDSAHQLEGSFLTFNNRPLAIEVYRDKLYTAVGGNPWTIYVHDQQGKQVNSWNHSDYDDWTGLAITSDKVVAPDRNNKLLIIYSLTGSKIKEISCVRLSKAEVSLCAAGLNKVVVSDYRSSQVFMVDIANGQLLWNCKDVSKPQGLTCYEERYVLVAAFGSTAVRVLDSSKGEIVSELTDSAIGLKNKLDMHISGDRLLVANRPRKNILIYQLLP